MGVRERYEAKKKNQSINSKKSSTTGVKERYEARKLKSTINFDTFESDLKSMGTTIQGIYDGWQTAETMKNTRSSVEAMQNRINAYTKYQKVFGGADLGELASSYQTILDDWDDRTALYGGFKNAKAYNKEKKNVELSNQFRVKTGTDEKTGEDTYRGLTYDEVQSKLKEYKKDSDEYKFLSEYAGYTDLNEFDKAIKNNKSNTDYVDDLKKKRNQWELDNKFDYYKHYMDAEDFEEKSKYNEKYAGITYQTERDLSYMPAWQQKYEKDKGDTEWLGVESVENKNYAYINNPTYKQSYLNYDEPQDEEMRTWLINEQGRTGVKSEGFTKFYDNLTEEEKKVYNYIVATEGSEKANDFLEDMQITLGKRQEKIRNDNVDEFIDGSAVNAAIASAISVPAKMIGTITGASEAFGDMLQGKEYNPYGYGKMYANSANYIRQTVGEDIAEATEGFEIAGQNIPSFLYQTGMSVADSAAGAMTFGKFNSVIMGTGAFQQKAKEMIEAGEDENTVFSTAFASGAAEMVFEYVSLDKLLKIKNVDGIKNGIKSALKQGGIEASEEFITELSNIVSDTALRGDNSELAQKYQDLKTRGYSESEINTELAKYIGGQLTWSSIGGALSGAGMGAGASVKAYQDMKSTGSIVRENERVNDLLDIARMTPREAEAYNLYTEYALRNNAEDMTDAQIGSLYTATEAGARETLSKRGLFSKSTTVGERENARETLKGLAKVDTENVELKRAKELAKSDVTKVVSSDTQAHIEGIKKDGENTLIFTSEGDISVDNMSFTESDADLVAYAEQMDENKANLFIEQYDGQTDIREYADSFNLVMAYSENDFTQDTILRNKGVLSEDQVNAIYKATVLDGVQEQQNAIDDLNTKHGNTMSVQSIIDDSIIDYENTNTNGKVNWNSLNTSQRKAITFMKGIATGTGMNLELIPNGMELGINGAFKINGNTIVLDIYAGMDKIDGTNFSDSIIPTASHEMTHWMKAKSPAMYQKISEHIFATLTKDGSTEEDIIARRLSQMQKNHPNSKFTVEEVRDEVIARACEDMLAMSEEGKKIFNSLSETEQKSFVDKIKDIIQDLKNWVNDLLSQYKSNSPEAKAMRKYQDRLDELSKMWDEMLKSSIQANQSLQKEGITGEELAKKVSGKEKTSTEIGEVQNSIREDFSKEYDAWDKKKSRFSFNVGTTSKVLQSLGIDSKQIRWDATKILKIQAEHPAMTDEIIKQVPTILENPVLVLKSKTVDGRLVLFGEVYDANNVPVLAVLELNPTSKKGIALDLIKIASAYGKDVGLQHFIDTSEVVYTDKKRIDNWLKLNRLKLPLANRIDSNNSIHQSKGNSQEKFSDRDNSDYSHIIEMQTELNQIRATIREMEASEEFKAEMDKLSEAVNGDNAVEGVEAYNQWKQDSGYGELITRKDTLQVELENLQKEFTENSKSKALKEEQEAIAKSGLSEADYFRKQAVKEFGYTPYFYDAGYITPNGKMLNFSGEKGQHFGSRGQDHRAIGIIYADDTQGTDALNRFMRDGNIRIMPESPSIDISTLVEPTTEQYSTIRKFIYEYAAKEYFAIDLTDESGKVIGSLEYENKINPTRIINDIKQYFATGEIREQSDIDKYRYSDRDSIDTEINQSMTMEEAKQMIQRAFVLGGIQEFYENEYKNGDEWLNGEGVDEVALYIENEYTLTEKYLNKIEGMYNGDFYVEDILKAYLNGTLTGKEKPKAKRLDIKKEYRVNDTRFYSPKRIKDVKKLFSVASQRLTDSNRAEVTKARAKILLFAHNEGASELLGLTQAELNKKLRAWSGYPAGARETSKRFNQGVADSNKWTGIENCSWLSKSTVTTEELESLVNSIEGAANNYEKLYIARTMLALDTHIDWSWLSFEFDSKAGVNAKHNGSGNVLGFYRNDARKIVVSHNLPNTVAHEMGHALDYQWGRDLGFTNSTMTDAYRNTELITNAESKQFFDNFKIFMDSLTDNGDISSEYLQDPKEVFARFVAKFIEWVDNTATGNRYYRTESSYYNDKFTASNYIEFVRLLQEKAMLDSRKMASENVEDVQYSDRDTEGNSLTKEQQDFFANSKVRDENGNLRVMWHGTDSNFTVFDIEKAGSNWGKDSRLGKGFYFANTKEDALKWTKGKTTIKAYLNLTNPLDLTATTPKNIVEEIDKYIDKLYASYDEKTYFITKEQYQNNLQRIKEMYLKDASMFIDLFKYDDNGNMTDGIREFLSALGYDGIVSKDETVAFYPEQIKDVENKNPTSNPDIQYSDRDTLSISNDEYSKLLSKKPIKATKKEMAKVGQQRIRRYANMTEDDVPNIDYFRLADYNKVNVAYLYTIRNVGKDYFSVVKKEVIKPQTIPRGINKSIQEAETNGRNDTNNARISQGISEVRTEGTHNSFSVYRSNNGRRGTVGNKLQENDKVVTSDGQSNNERYNGEDLSNTRREQRGDLKFSDRDNVSVYDVMGQTKALKKENELLKADVERLKERLALERKVTHGNYFEPKQLEAAAKHIRHLANSNIDIKTLMTYFDGVYSYIAHSPDLNWQDMFAQCYDVASMVLDEAKPITVSNDYAKMILRDIRSAKISVSEAQKGDARYKLGNRWHNKFFGKITITDSGISLDSQWKEWASAYPDIFDAEISEAQQLAELYDIIESLKETSEMVVEYDVEERTRWLAREIYNQYWNVSPIRTTADKYDKQIKLLNFKHRQMMKELRDGYEDRLTKQKQADRTYYRDLIRNIRERKDAEIKEVRELGKKRMSEYKERVERNTLIQSITAQSLTLNRWLTKNSKDEHIHEALKGPVINLLQAINFSSKQLLGMKGTVKDRRGTPTQKDISLQNALTQVQSMMGKASVGEATLVELYGHGLDDEIASLVTSVNEMMRTVGDNEFILNQMSIEELKTLSKIVSTIKASVTKMNKFHTVNHAKGIAALAQEQIAYADSLGNLKVANPETLKGKLQKLTKWDNSVPYYAFKRFGIAGKKIFEAFQDGWDKLAFHAKEIIDFTEKTYTDKEINEWSKDIKSFKVLVPTTEALSGDPSYKPQYDNIQMTVPQIMSLYCSMKREQARKHIFGGGIKVADIVSDKKDIISQNDNVQLTESDVKNIISTLTDRQKQVADALQEFMNDVCSKWGNEISMARFGYLAFGEENYFPIQVDKDNLNDAGENGEDIKPPNTSLFALLNMSFTKTANDNANNALVLNDIFDVFAQHSSDMAKYNALALPVLDAFRWYNYSEKNYINDKQYKTKSVKKSIKNAYGEQGKRYIKTFLQDINGQQNVSRDTLGKGFFTNAKLASVALNLRVALLQPTAYLKAGAVMKNKYLTKALMHKPKINRAEKYCGMALWKSLGYYDTDISKGLTEKIKHSETLKDKAIEVSMKGAEWGDKLTFGYLWNACELEIRDTRKDLKVGSDEFNNAIGKRLREVIYATQVVDSTMTRSQIMRSGNMYEKMLTAFSSEPTLAYNMLQDVWVQGSLEKRANGKVSKETAKKTVKVLTAYTVTNIVAALVESGFDALRDDDDEEMDVAKFMQYYLANFGQDMSIMAKIPYLKEIVSVAQGFTSSRSDTQWMESFSNSIKGVWKLSQGEGNPNSVFKNILRTISYFSGLPFYNAYRDFMATLNKLEILTAEDLEELFGDFFD